MKKNIVIGLLTVITCLSLVFAYMQRRVAEASRAEAIEAKLRADSLNLILIHEAELAQRNLERAISVYNQAKEKTDSLKIKK
jgi:hypothetical protein